MPDEVVFRRLEQQVRQKYADLRLIAENGKYLLRGSFPIEHDGRTLDRFSIEISFPDGPNGLPAILETGHRIPRIRDRHINPNGTICAEVPEVWLLKGKKSLLEYLDGPVRNYFLGQLLVEQGEPWPFGEWDHGRAGLLQAYGELLGVTGESAITRYLGCLTHKKIKKHWPCPCGNGKPIRGCHSGEVRVLQERIPPRIARQALERLRSS